MADYCYTKFTITGEREKLNELFNLCFSKNKIHDTYYFDFEKIIPSPKAKEDCHPRYYLKPGMPIQPNHIDLGLTGIYGIIFTGILKGIVLKQIIILKRKDFHY